MVVKENELKTFNLIKAKEIEHNEAGWAEQCRAGCKG